MAKKKAKPKAKAPRHQTDRTPKKRSAPDWTPKFLKALASTSNIRAACVAAKVPILIDEGKDRGGGRGKSAYLPGQVHFGFWET